MDYDNKWERVAVLGAAGKMGSGILLLTSVEMADLSLKPENRGRTFAIQAIDVSVEGLSGLMKYLRAQVLRIAEKKMVWLRLMYADRADLVDNGQIIQQYVFDVLNIVRPTIRIEAAYDCHLIFEAIKEDPDLKKMIFRKIDGANPHKPWYLTNTSSIPISELDRDAGLDGRIIGFHFYNPPAVQKLVELIRAESTVPSLEAFALEYAERLGKLVVRSNDKAGFIGNGHFMRDALHGISEAERLAAEVPLYEAIWMINKVSQDYLVRPMGIFQLIDYVGLDIMTYIMDVMNPHFRGEEIHSPMLMGYLELGIRGGQHSDGSQKDGILRYDKGRPVGVFDLASEQYIAVEHFRESCEARLGPLPQSFQPWKQVVGSKMKEKFFTSLFQELKTMDTAGARLALNYACRSKEIGQQLVANGIARSDEDVNTVLLTGFFHTLGPINNYV
ncbi:MAG: 3-hydroxyacyl-CoA dehydrogenase family protein [Bacteroidales bacterium]